MSRYRYTIGLIVGVGTTLGCSGGRTALPDGDPHGEQLQGSSAGTTSSEWSGGSATGASTTLARLSTNSGGSGSAAAGDAAGADGAAGAGGAPWWQSSCEPIESATLGEPNLPPCSERLLHMVVVDDRATNSFAHSTPSAISNAGHVVGTWNPGSDLEDRRAWIWSDGVRLQIHSGSNVTQSWGTDVNVSGAFVGRLRYGGELQPFVYEAGVETRFLSAGNASGINDRGDVIGVSYEPNGGGFVRVDGTEHVLPTPQAGGYTAPLSINNRRQIVGDMGDATLQRAFLLSCGELLELGTLGGVRASAHDINERGQIVGMSTDESGTERAFLYENGQMQPLPAELGSRPKINDRGELAGSHYVYFDGQLHDVRGQLIDTLPCWRSLQIMDINDHGDMIAEVLACDPVEDYIIGHHAVVLTTNPERYR
jgi:probable HAF family extracellular repeat protein